MTNTLPGKMAFIDSLKKKDSRLETIKDTFSTRTACNLGRYKLSRQFTLARISPTKLYGTIL